MGKDKFSLGWYAFALVGGLVSGLCFSRSQYHQGKIDAYNEVTKELEKVQEDVEQYLEEHKEEEAQ